MANELLEAVPAVQSMPTTGWFCQTSGNARRRITENSSTYKTNDQDTQGTFDVSGVPGHTHNASAVVSVEADYSAYRQRALTIPAGIWAYGALNLPVGLLTDSVEPDNAEERYERAIERCVGYTALRPENCTGSIREPTRSIGEIRTLVTPKSRLDTLTYVEERRGWRVPLGADDEKETSVRAALVSSFPDVYIDVRPLTVVQDGTLNLGTSPSSLYLESPTFRYMVQAAADTYTVGRTASNEYDLGLATLAGDAAEVARLEAIQWDGTLRFVWDSDERLYKTLASVSITLDDVREVALADGAVQATGIYNVLSGAALPAQPKHRITVTFPVLKTTRAFDGYCWLGNMHNEEAINYANRTAGLNLAPRIEVEVVGITNNIGPFQWIGLPAYRIPVGGTYAHPCSDILPELLGDGTHTDLQSNFYDKYDAFKENTDIAQVNGFLRYQWRQDQQIVVAAAAQGNNVAIEAAKASQHVFDFAARTIDKNSGMFVYRSAGILNQLTATTQAAYPTYPSFVVGATVPYAQDPAQLAEANLITSGLSRSSRLGVIFGNNVHPMDDGVFTNELEGGNTVSFRGTFTIQYPLGVLFGNNNGGGPNIATGILPGASDKYAAVPMSPILYRGGVGTLVANYQNNELAIGQAVAAAGQALATYRFVPQVICPVQQVSGTVCTHSVDLRSVFTTDDESGLNHVPSFSINAGTYELPTGTAVGNQYFLRGWSLFLHHLDDNGSSFENDGAFANNAQTSDNVRNAFRSVQYGNKFLLEHGIGESRGWTVVADPTVNANAMLQINDYVFAIPDSTVGLYFEAVAAAANLPNGSPLVAGRKFFFFAPFSGRAKPHLHYHADGLRIITAFRELYTWNQEVGDMQTRRVTLLEMQAIAALALAGANNQRQLNMYIIGKDWYDVHVTGDPYAAVRFDTARLGAVYQSIKRISQHVCAPVLNPNLRIGSSAPLNHDTRHLPPELRDFRLELQDIDWARLRAKKLSIKDLTLYEFKDGNQKVGSEQNIMYLPQFREHKLSVAGGEFEFTTFSELGSPSYFCLFCRSATTDILQQPLIQTLSIICNTTKKKSNTISDATIGQLYHLTQRNVHPAAEYDRIAFKRRQTVLLSAEDVGMLGLQPYEYQKAKRVEYVFSGTTNNPGTLHVVLVYNNRGLHIDGRRLQLVTLHE